MEKKSNNRHIIFITSSVIILHIIVLFYQVSTSHILSFSELDKPGSTFQVKIARPQARLATNSLTKLKSKNKLQKDKLLQQSEVTPQEKQTNLIEGGESSSLAKYLSELRTLIARHKEYPMMAKRLRQEGTVVIKFIIRANGKILNVEIIKECSHDILNTEALKTVMKVKSFKQFPKELSQDEIEVVFPIEFIIS